jgi:hypothetical protein
MDNHALSPKTIKQYRGLANNFYKGITGNITPDSMAAHLQSLACQHKQDTWRKLRRAISYDQHDKGYIEPAKRISKQTYPSTILPLDRPYITPKVKTVKHEEFLNLYHGISNKNLKAALVVAKFTGCRPAEMLYIKSLGNNKFFIPSAKRTEDGLRGLDRIIQLDEKFACMLDTAIKALAKLDPDKGQVALQKALYRATKKLWPRRKKQIVFYSFRHQLASNLKSVDMSNKERSYIMGHQSTASIGRYGNRRSGTGACSISAGVTPVEINKLVRKETSVDYLDNDQASAKDKSSDSNSSLSSTSTLS